MENSRTHALYTHNVTTERQAQPPPDNLVEGVKFACLCGSSSCNPPPAAVCLCGSDSCTPPLAAVCLRGCSSCTPPLAAVCLRGSDSCTPPLAAVCLRGNSSCNPPPAAVCLWAATAVLLRQQLSAYGQRQLYSSPSSCLLLWQRQLYTPPPATVWLCGSDSCTSSTAAFGL